MSSIGDKPNWLQHTNLNAENGTGVSYQINLNSKNSTTTHLVTVFFAGDPNDLAQRVDHLVALKCMRQVHKKSVSPDNFTVGTQVTLVKQNVPFKNGTKADVAAITIQKEDENIQVFTKANVNNQYSSTPLHEGDDIIQNGNYYMNLSGERVKSKNSGVSVINRLTNVANNLLMKTPIPAPALTTTTPATTVTPLTPITTTPATTVAPPMPITTTPATTVTPLTPITTTTTPANNNAPPPATIATATNNTVSSTAKQEKTPASTSQGTVTHVQQGMKKDAVHPKKNTTTATQQQMQREQAAIAVEARQRLEAEKKKHEQQAAAAQASASAQQQTAATNNTTTKPTAPVQKKQVQAPRKVEAVITGNDGPQPKKQ
jgi:hypothetical protein